MANMYCPYCEEKHEIKAHIKNVFITYKGHIIKHKTMFYECERVPKGEGVFWSGKMVQRNSNFFDEAVKQKGLV